MAVLRISGGDGSAKSPRMPAKSRSSKLGIMIVLVIVCIFLQSCAELTGHLALSLPWRSPQLVPGSAEAIARTKDLLLKADAAFFDVDSTVVKTEGIDLLGKCFGVMKEISELTNKAMNGNVKFQDAMADRLQLMAEHGMDEGRLEKCVKTEGAPQWSPGVQEVVKMLHKQGTDVYLVSGGFQNMIKPVALELHIPQNKIYANEILFDGDGNYAGFDRTAPTSASGGKPKVLSMMKKRHGYKTMIMFGDGATDMDARTNGPASAFIGYGGVVVREKIQQGADWFITSFDEILDVLPKGTDLIQSYVD
jgi:phosphoserine phosphatase